MGLQVLPPCVNHSRVGYLGSGDAVRVGLMQVRSLRRDSARALVDERRRHGRFENLADLGTRVQLRPAELEALIRCGGLAGFGVPRTQLLFETLVRRGGRRPGPPPAEGRPVSGPERLLAELETLGVALSGHPMELFAPWLPRERVVAAALEGHAGQEVVLAGWPVASRPLLTSGRRPMELVSFEDETDLFDAAVFPAAYESVARTLVKRGPCVVRGRVRLERGHASVTVRRLEPLSIPPCPPSV